MGKGIIDLYPKETYEHIITTKLWKEYINHFGNEINSLFGDNYAVKLRFGHFYREVIDGQFQIALRTLRDYKENFKSDYDLELYDKFEKICLNIENMKNVSKGDWIKDDCNNYYLVISGTIEEAIIKEAFNSKLKFRINLSDSNYFSIKKTTLYCYRNLNEEELRKINNYFDKNKYSYDDLLRYTDKYFYICSLLKENGFEETLIMKGNFYKYITDETAFAINVKDYGKYIGIVYGVTTTSMFKEYKEYLISFGKDDDEITLREFLKIFDIESEENVKKNISDFLAKYKSLSKKELLEVSKEKRKQFINCFHSLLKPLGFKKNSNKWSKDLNDSLIFNFYVNKSQYSDSYYIDTWVNKKENNNLICYSKRYLYNGCQNLNWQFINLEEFDKFLKETIIKEVELIINTPLDKLINEQQFLKNCYCNKKRCNNCFIK